MERSDNDQGVISFPLPCGAVAHVSAEDWPRISRLSWCNKGGGYVHGKEKTMIATHRHKKRGTEYVLIGLGKMQTEFWYTTKNEDVRTVDMREVAVYRSAADPTEIWVRPLEEFEDRFEVLASLAPSLEQDE